MTKKILSRITLLSVFMACFALTACSPDDRMWRDETDFYGKWYYTSDDGYYLTNITFYSDGYGIIEDWEGDYLVAQDRFEWQARSRYIDIYYYDRDVDDRWGYRFMDYDGLEIDFGGDYRYYFVHM